MNQRSQRSRHVSVGLVLVLPGLIMICAFAVFPLVYGIYLSFFAKHAWLPAYRFIGFGNYLRVLTDPELWRAFWVDLLYMGSTVSLQLATGMGMALLLNQKFLGRAIVRGALIFPYILPTVGAVVIWRWMFNDLAGVVNHILMELQVIDSPIVYSANPTTALVFVIIVAVYRFFPFITLALLARLQSIPVVLYEAAVVDGASPWRRFWNITLPQLEGVIVLVCILRGVWMFTEFDALYLLTGGGPLGATQTLPLLAYKKAFYTWKPGQGAAIAVFTMAVLLVGYLFYSKKQIELMEE